MIVSIDTIFWWKYIRATKQLYTDIDQSFLVANAAEV